MDQDKDRECSLDCAGSPQKSLCASDGRTFLSRCEFQRAKCKDPQLEIAYRGNCKGEQIETFQYFPLIIMKNSRQNSFWNLMNIENLECWTLRVAWKEVDWNLSYWFYNNVLQRLKLIFIPQQKYDSLTSLHYNKSLGQARSNSQDCSLLKLLFYFSLLFWVRKSWIQLHVF